MNNIEFNKLKKVYHSLQGETLALDNFSLTINDGDFIALVGPSGCGKSTLLSMIGGLENPSDGKIIFPKKDYKTAYMLQQDTLFPWLTILDNCLLGLKINRKLTDEDENKVINLLNMYGLKDFIHVYPNSLSGGMRQRAALIRTLATNPDLLLLDEPFSALDYQTRLSVSNDVYDIIKKEKKTAIMVTHDISEAISMADKVVVLSKRPAQLKNVYEIKFQNPGTPFENRTKKEFIDYYDLIWKDLDINV